MAQAQLPLRIESGEKPIRYQPGEGLRQHPPGMYSDVCSHGAAATVSLNLALRLLGMVMQSDVVQDVNAKPQAACMKARNNWGVVERRSCDRLIALRHRRVWMNLFEYYAGLRSEILDVIAGVQRSGYSLFRDNTIPNGITRKRLQELCAKYIKAAKEFGLLVVTIHCECPNPAHVGSLISNRYGLDISSKDSRFIWTGGQFYQGSRSCVCPCSRDNFLTKHHVIDCVIYDKIYDANVCKRMEMIFDDIFESIDCAEDKKPRSAIRECLLRAVLNINDELLPETMDEYIRNHR